MELVLEGTWEEIKLREAEFTGRHIKLIVDMDQMDSQQPAIQKRLKAWSEFVSNGVDGIVIDDSREAMYGYDKDRG